MKFQTSRLALFLMVAILGICAVVLCLTSDPDRVDDRVLQTLVSGGIDLRSVHVSTAAGTPAVEIGKTRGETLTTFSATRPIPQSLAKLVLQTRSLQHLRLTGAEIGSTELRQICDMKQLARLELVDCDIANTDASHSPPLTLLELSSSRCDSQAAKTLAGCGQIEALRLTHAAIPCDGIASMIATNPNLTELGLYGCRCIGEIQTELHTLSRLRSLDVGKSNVTDEFLADSSFLTRLTLLNLHDTEITGNFLRNAPEMPRLEKIGIVGCDRLLPQFREMLQKNARNVEISP